MRALPIIPTVVVLAVAGLSAGCGGTPQVKYQPGDRTAAPGQVEVWTFDKDTAG